MNNNNYNNTNTNNNNDDNDDDDDDDDDGDDDDDQTFPAVLLSSMLRSSYSLRLGLLSLTVSVTFPFQRVTLFPE